MGLFGSNKKVELTDGWVEITAVNELTDIDEASMQKPVVIFKHSTRCSISGFAYNFLFEKWKNNQQAPSLYYLDLLNHRDISNAIAERYQVEHQSPQIIVIQDGKAVYNASHSSISEMDLTEFS